MIDQEKMVFPSGRSVGNCRKDAKALARDGGLPLHAALDAVAARNGGGDCWAERAKALSEPRPAQGPVSAGVSRADIAAVLEQHPILSSHGIGLVRQFLPAGVTGAEELKRARDELLERADQVDMCLQFLAFTGKRKTINFSTNSYGFKHKVEYFQRRHVDRPLIPYVSNGAFICAAIMAGFNFHAEFGREPNVFLNISQKGVFFEWHKLDWQSQGGLTVQEWQRFVALSNEMGLCPDRIAAHGAPG